MSTSVVCSIFVVLCMLNVVNSDVIVKTAYGQVRGTRTEKSIEFLGIPFATPPVGNLRYGYWHTNYNAACQPYSQDMYNAALGLISTTYFITII